MFYIKINFKPDGNIYEKRFQIISFGIPWMGYPTNLLKYTFKTKSEAILYLKIYYKLKTTKT